TAWPGAYGRKPAGRRLAKRGEFGS
ncbi:uncharacterized protein METZ01_LOCUS480662, partial [marine metagenome]